MKQTFNLIRYELSAADCARLNTGPSLIFRYESEANQWFKDNRVTDAKWHGYCVLMERE